MCAFPTIAWHNTLLHLMLWFECTKGHLSSRSDIFTTKGNILSKHGSFSFIYIYGHFEKTGRINNSMALAVVILIPYRKCMFTDPLESIPSRLVTFQP